MSLGSKATNRPKAKYLALVGIVGPLLFTIVIIFNASLRPNYSHDSDFISELGAMGTPNAVVMNVAGFLPFGLLMAAFGLSLLFLLPRDQGLRIGSILVFIFGLGVFIAGLFPCDIGCPEEGSSTNMIHNRVSALSFFSVTIGIGVLGISFKRLREWQGLWLYSVITCVVSAGFLAAMISSIPARTHTGLWQRFLLLTLFIWFFLMATKVFNFKKQPHAQL